MSEKSVVEGAQAAGQSSAENESPMKKTPSKRKSHIERIQEENKELLKSMGIEELATSESRSTRRSTRSNTKGPAQPPVTPPTPKRQPAPTPTSSRRGKKKKDEEDEMITKEEEPLVVEKKEVDSEAVEIPSQIQSTPPRKRQKLSETTMEEDKKDTAVENPVIAEERPKKCSPAVEESMEGVTENTLESFVNEPSAEHAEVDFAKVCITSAEKPVDSITEVEIAPAIVVREPMPDIESAKIEESFEQQISSTSGKIEEATIVDQGKQVPDVEPAVEIINVKSEPTQVFEISSENRPQALVVEKSLPFESITEQSKIETTQASIETERAK